MFIDILLGGISLSETDVWSIAGWGALVVIDFLTGMLGALLRGDFSSSVMRVGIGHKAMCALIVVLAAVLQLLAVHVTMLPIFPAVSVVCVYLIIMEVGSVWETIVKTYPELAGTKLEEFFDDFKDGDNDGSQDR